MANLSSYLPGGIDPAAVTITGGTINGTTIGASTPSTGAFTTFTSTGIDDNATSTAITIDSSENVGIGTTSPGAPLQVGGASAGDAALWFNTSGTSYAEIEAVNFGFNYNMPLILQRQGGNVGIGTDSPSDKLSVSVASNSGSVSFFGGTQSSRSLKFTASNAGGFDNSAWEINQSADNSGSLLIFKTRNTERMRIDSSGNLLVGTTSSVANVGGLSVDATGSFHCASFQAGGNGYGIVLRNSGGTTVGSIAMGASTTAFNTSSDERLKENIVDAPAGNIDAIRVRSFDWKVDGSHQTYGMVAQELVDVAPEAVTQGETEDDMWGVDYSKLVPMMIKEIQDLKAEVAAQRAELSALKGA